MMKLPGLLKQKHGRAAQQSVVILRQRKQLNVKVDSRLKSELQRLAVKFSVPRDIVAEHALETGCFYMERSLENEDLVKTVRQHLIDVHQLGEEVNDTKSILRIGEGSNISELLDQVEPVLRSWYAFRRAMAVAQRTEKITYLETCKKQLLREVVKFAMWLEQNHMDEPQ
ncbi:hypothetical protein ACFLUU_01210 [Chloroflexota bacterium]